MTKALMPSATKCCLLKFKCKNLFYLRNKNKIRREESSAESGQVSPEGNYGQLRRGNPRPQKIPTIRSSWLARSFLWLPYNPRFVVFFLSHFLQSTLHLQCYFFKTTVSICPQAKSRRSFQPPPSCPPCARKKQLKAFAPLRCPKTEYKVLYSAKLTARQE